MDSTQFLNPEQVNFDENKNALLLGVNKNAVDWSSMAEPAQKNGFEQKDELHITIIGFGAGGEIGKTFERLGGERNGVMQRLRSLIDGTDWKFYLEPQRFHVQKDYVMRDRRNGLIISTEHRESYIQMVSVPAIQIFFQELNSMFGTNFLPPPTHITLYTRGNNSERARMGIGINSQEEFLSLHPQLI